MQGRVSRHLYGRLYQADWSRRFFGAHRRAELAARSGCNRRHQRQGRPRRRSFRALYHYV